jgi:DNA-binding MarR family transcriptional regulator
MNAIEASCSRRAASARRTLSQPLAYALSAAIIGAALFASATPSPLYETYASLWAFSSVVLTLIYATYAIGVLMALLLAGRVSDAAGRRPALAIALGALLGATVLYMVAGSVACLFAARAVQGVATGLALGTASAALLDFHPRQDPEGVGLTNGVVSAAGLGFGALASSVAGMSPSEFLVLRDLFINGPSSISEIVARTDLAQSRVSICIRSHVNRGWVTTGADQADGRKTIAQVTDRVKTEAMKRRNRNARDALVPLLAGASPEERAGITAALQRLYELAVDARDETLGPQHLETARRARTRIRG